ncbi:MAG: hypothetical protein HZC38_18175 [Chloroflexi bacterium]|nr:hypothetical protein [Chloroflexota bacterium]
MNPTKNSKKVLSLAILLILLTACSNNLQNLPTLASVPTLIPTKLLPTSVAITLGASPVAGAITARPAATVNTKPDLAATVAAEAAAATTRTPPAVLTAIQVSATALAKAATPTKASSNTGYLWWVTDRKQRVLVYGPSHQSIPRDVDTAEGWATRGEACFAEGGARYVLDKSIPAPSDGVGVQITSGKCNGFKGWVFTVATHAEAP